MSEGFLFDNVFSVAKIIIIIISDRSQNENIAVCHIPLDTDVVLSGSRVASSTVYPRSASAERCASVCRYDEDLVAAQRA